MTRSGMILFNELTYFFMVDQQNLGDGTIFVVTFARNGEVECEVRPRVHFVSYLLSDSESLDSLPSSPVGGLMCGNDQRDRK